ncbi:pyridoxamine 5'-phosphate oxidase family protein [Streptomyces sp. VRA16 Mangrove soil]|uniref:pyridoxamine 5'-phosphate oxidase family protein n=1 Tax=Streptomyces sp. VRA16 Mangrove soil TaxID=2817434 RepID=UPI001A9FCF80|nr:pyridoxamine 5'-phosphate oxidase family protein [Streptomyces sp. VRA16 Mangrove soil]MBO1331384.1 pyridoxamine 5'-phosphate oxidase family protein [Streptomyces sp. VRA16 Mangrove soil]
MARQYHRGELAVQNRAELAHQASHALAGIGGTVPPIAAAFLADQRMIVVGGTDAAGRIWATQLTGAPGFLRTPDPTTLTVDAVPHPKDPLAEVLGGPATVGMIAIEPATRRRMRLNGRSTPVDGGLRVDLDQVISNCPKYIQKREVRTLRETETAPASHAVTRGTSLTPAQQAALRATDTFFVATSDGSGNTDASHRGGNPGFVEVLSPTLLRWPDYVGNAMFLTLGNLELRSAAGLLVPGWDNGSTLHLSGTARTVWDTAEISRVPGAQRLVEFTVTDVVQIDDAVPLRWSAPAYSRFNPPVS